MTLSPRAAELFRDVESSDDVAYVLTADLCLAALNRGWETFALANGGEHVLARWRPGAPIVDAISGPLRAFYLEAFARALSGNAPWEHDYECSSPDRFRSFRMISYPADGQLVVVHSSRVDRPHAEEPGAPSSDDYDESGFVTMCSYCRRIRRARRPETAERWDWVPAYVRAPTANLSHGLCPTCFMFHYPGVARQIE